MSLVTKQQMIEAKDLPFKDVPVPEWGGDVRVRTLTGSLREVFEQRVHDQRKGSSKDIKEAHMDLRGLKNLLLSLCLVDESGEPLFAGEKEAVEVLSSKSGNVLNRLFEVAADLNGLGEAALADIAKNSEGDRKD